MKPAIDSSGIAGLVGRDATQKGAPEEVIPALLAALRKHLGMDAAFVAEFVDTRRVFRFVDAAVEGAPRPGDSDALEASYCKLVAEGRIPELITDAGVVAPERAFVMGRPVGSQVCVAMIAADGRTYGTFCCFSREPDATLGERDLALTGVFSELALHAIERARAASSSQAEIRKRITHVLKLDKVHAVFQPMVTLDDRPELELGVIRRALPALEKLPQPMPISFNVSPQLLLEGRLARELAPGIAGRVVLEIAEHETVKEYEKLVTALEPLRRAGVKVAIDDAGAGYSTFRHIVTLDPDVIKLDLRLTRDIDHDPARRALASALIGYAREAKAEVVAEGLETQAELDTLLGLGIRKAQGHYFGKPMSLSAAVELSRR